ncbi:hypothetical protein ACONUD_13600 [Microbulbifer harenosus]|uniref:Uncharacterized protein n=1 Tax=Microbulbifer harenosus TaxID=2576840 RepID=A0ABY2ULW8_9GAMM|nr:MULTISPECIES: hypothetical protein [Microbulbifer]QIL91086.1 hypothetical protein GNX18_15865 [Microbulbifer sp. SH-1]TLM79305.1 hypothetical protein FDY93_04205 [Microbulbifer harenosus]
MRYLIPVVLFCSLSGAALAQQPISQLPAGASEVQIMGTTYWRSGNNFYQFNQDTGLFYQVPQPTVQAHKDRVLQAHMYQRSQTLPGTGLSSDQLEGCRNVAADKSNAVPNRGSEVFINAYNSCIRDLQR